MCDRVIEKRITVMSDAHLAAFEAECVSQRNKWPIGSGPRSVYSALIVAAINERNIRDAEKDHHA